MPTLTQLEYVVAVDKHRHFGKASEACHISQPTLSMQIQKLEEELSITLFDRDKKPIIPTSHGRKFIEQAKLILQDYEKLIHIGKNSENEISGDFKLGIIPTIAPYLIPLFIKAFSEKFPRVNLHIDELKTSSIIESLQQESIDAGILATPLHEKSLKEKPLFYEPFLLYAAQDHPLAKNKKVNERDLSGNDMWLLQDGHCFRNQVIRFCSLTDNTSFFKNVYFEGGNLETLRNLIRNGGGYTLIPYLFSAGLEKTDIKNHVREFTPPIPTREVSLVCRSNQWRLDILEAIRGVIIKSVPPSLAAMDKKNQVVLDIQP
jgi:LysR family hydrogen peroxide-inducible transcriptional activator